MNKTPEKIKVVRCGFNDDGAYYTIDSNEVSRATINLIEAAPEMLALLQKLVDIEGVQPGDYLWAREVFSVIKKALGEDE